MLQQLLGIIQYNEQTNQQMNQGERNMRPNRQGYQRGPRQQIGGYNNQMGQNMGNQGMNQQQQQ